MRLIVLALVNTYRFNSLMLIENLLSKYSELGGQIITIDIPLAQYSDFMQHQRLSNIGLLLSGNKDLNQMSAYVFSIRPGSLIEIDRQMAVGDQLLEVCSTEIWIFV